MSDVSDQFGERAVVLCIRAVRLTGRGLAKAMKAVHDRRQKVKAVKAKPKGAKPKDYANTGKQTVKQLAKQGQGLSNIEIKDENIKSFDGIARKYGVDYALKKDKTVYPPVWLVFFKARNADALTAAFKEFGAKEAKRNATRESVLGALESFGALVKNQVIDKVKNKMHGGHEL